MVSQWLRAAHQDPARRADRARRTRSRSRSPRSAGCCCCSWTCRRPRCCCSSWCSRWSSWPAPCSPSARAAALRGTRTTSPSVTACWRSSPSARCCSERSPRSTPCSRSRAGRSTSRCSWSAVSDSRSVCGGCTSCCRRARCWNTGAIGRSSGVTGTSSCTCSIAAVGAGLHVVALYLEHAAHIDATAVMLSVAIPVAVYFVSLGVLYGNLIGLHHRSAVVTVASSESWCSRSCSPRRGRIVDLHPGHRPRAGGQLVIAQETGGRGAHGASSCRRRFVDRRLPLRRVRRIRRHRHRVPVEVPQGDAGGPLPRAASRGRRRAVGRSRRRQPIRALRAAAGMVGVRSLPTACPTATAPR